MKKLTKTIDDNLESLRKYKTNKEFYTFAKSHKILENKLFNEYRILIYKMFDYDFDAKRLNGIIKRKKEKLNFVNYRTIYLTLTFSSKLSQMFILNKNGYLVKVFNYSKENGPIISLINALSDVRKLVLSYFNANNINGARVVLNSPLAFLLYVPEYYILIKKEIDNFLMSNIYLEWTDERSYIKQENKIHNVVKNLESLEVPNQTNIKRIRIYSGRKIR